MTAHRDDHHRNHGFLRRAEGWRLAPAFDLNPTPQKPDHEVSLDGAARRGDLDVLRATASFYRLAESAAERIIEGVASTVAARREAARGAGLGSVELDVREEAIVARP